MIESKKTIYGLAAVLAALLCALLVLALLPRASAYDPNLDQISLFSYSTNDIARVELTKDGLACTLIHEQDKWKLSDGTELSYDSADLIVTFLAYLYSDYLIDENAAELTQYGLVSPQATAAFICVNGVAHSVDFGLLSPSGKSVYMRVDKGSAVYTMPVEAFEILFGLLT